MIIFEKSEDTREVTVVKRENEIRSDTNNGLRSNTMNRKVYITMEMKADLIIDIDEGANIDEVLSTIEFICPHDEATIVDTDIQIQSWEITDSK